MSSSGQALADDAMQVLFVCTANQCRSPMAELLMRRSAVRHGLPMTVSSAGFGGSGRPASTHAAAALRPWDLDLGMHRSRRVDREQLAEADLVLAMERQHVSTLVELSPDVWPRAFTLKEAVARAAQAEPRQMNEPLSQWVAALHFGRRPADVLGGSDEDDVLDPMGGPARAVRRTASELDALITRLVDHASGQSVPTDLAMDLHPRLSQRRSRLSFLRS